MNGLGRRGSVPLTATNPTEITGLALVATTGSYTNLEDVPTFADVATSGDYADLTGTPTDPNPNVPDAPGGPGNFLLYADELGASWNPSSNLSLSDFNNDLGLSTVATSGDFNDLLNAPEPEVNPNVPDAPAPVDVNTIDYALRVWESLDVRGVEWINLPPQVEVPETTNILVGDGTGLIGDSGYERGHYANHTYDQKHPTKPEPTVSATFGVLGDVS